MGTLITIVLACIASSGFWGFIQFLMSKKSKSTKLLLGLAHDRIINLGKCYLEQGYITADEYEGLDKYLYEPYRVAGGNGSAEKIMNQINKLPMKTREEN